MRDLQLLLTILFMNVYKVKAAQICIIFVL